MQVGHYQIATIVLNAGRLPAFAGSAFRGAFGHALRKTSCADKAHVCLGCQDRTTCLYFSLFEVQANPQGQSPSQVSAPPHPYVIVPPNPTRGDLRAGDALSFEFRLFGPANRHLPRLIEVFDEMGRAGVSIRDERLRFAVSDISSHGQTIYRKADGQMISGEWTRPLDLNGNEACAEGALQLRLQTPLRLKVGGNFTDALPFPVLTRALLRRVSILSEAFSPSPLKLDYRNLLDQAEGIKVVESDLKWWDFSRYSNRQQKTMKLGGIVGNVTYQGRLGPFLPLLAFCKETHIGKQTSFGLGQFDYTWREDAA